jgi:hypothetical protein
MSHICRVKDLDPHVVMPEKAFIITGHVLYTAQNY